ncbi:NERD domain-containing protein [Psychrobacillus sp. NPDC096426]|uniref:NERD domain-containing protein n=1 Tax=Psychrobacillus sp. NPDC096426 TaxID=3364491 RepID=UPI0038112000
MEAGFHGETRTDRSLREVQFPTEVYIIPDFHMKVHHNRYIQIDTLIITSSYILIIEVKNMIGTINFKTSPSQIVRILNDEITPFKCPIVQLERNQDGLQIWRDQNNWNIPIYTALVFASDKAIIENAPSNKNILFIKNLPLYIQKLNKIPPTLSKEQFRRLIQKLLQKNIRFVEKPLCEKFEINLNELKKGILCSHCGDQLYRLTERKWICSRCGKQDNDPIPQNIEDLFILIKPEITMKECEQLLQPKSRFMLNYTFKKMQLIKTEKGNSTTYKKSIL